MASHLEETLRRDLLLIRSKITAMASLGERALKASLQALIEGNRQLAYSVILRDQYIDELETELDRLCLEFLVRQQPVGTHLRFVYATVKLNKELERIGDYAESVARQVLLVSSLDPQPDYEKFIELGHLSIHMFGDAVQSFLHQDEQLARGTMAIEERADQIRTRINADLLRLQQENRLPLEALTPLMTVARRFERVADQSKNICEETIYVCTGLFAKHRGGHAFRILFLDEGNACLSQMAEGIGNALGIERFQCASAGLAPVGLDPRTVEFMASKGIDISGQTSQSLDQVLPLDRYQVLVALAPGAKTVFPLPPNKSICLTWGPRDPTELAGDSEAMNRAFEEAWRFLDSHIRDLVEAILGTDDIFQRT